MNQAASPDSASRRRLLGGAASLGLILAAPPALGAAALAARTRARYRLAKDYAIPPEAFGIVPWNVTVFQDGSDFTLQPDGKILINTTGLYELVFSSDWDAKSNRDIDLRKIGIRRQALGQPDEPIDAHERLGFTNMPGSDPPAMARYQGDWSPPTIALGQTVSTDVTVTELGGDVRPGDTATAAHSSISQGKLSEASLSALIVQAKVIATNTVRVSLFNPSISGGISLAPGTLSVLAMSSARTRGSNGDSWMMLHTASTQLDAGDKVYGLIQHKVAGTLLQATKSSYLQIDRLG
jgi:hypothetical protein